MSFILEDLPSIKPKYSKKSQWVQGGSPRALALDQHGHLYISDVLCNQIQVCQLDGTFIRAIGDEGSGPAQFQNPQGLAFASSGTFLWSTRKITDFRGLPSLVNSSHKLEEREYNLMVTWTLLRAWPWTTKGTTLSPNPARFNYSPLLVVLSENLNPQILFSTQKAWLSALKEIC